jgi:DNA-binding response OmpR family regulator
MSASSHRQPRVLAIDASEDVRSLYEEMLREEGYAIATLACQEATRETVRAFRPDVVLLDCFVWFDPSGWDLLQVLSLDVELQLVPVVICTADSRLLRDDVHTSVDESIRILPKPFDVQELLTAIRASLARPQSPFTNGMPSEVRK